jgi:hypothetical protein
LRLIWDLTDLFGSNSDLLNEICCVPVHVLSNHWSHLGTRIGTDSVDPDFVKLISC